MVGVRLVDQGVDKQGQPADGFQPGIGAADVTPVFADYEAFLRRALPAVEVAGAQGPVLPALSTPRNCTRVSPSALMVAVDPAVADPQVEPPSVLVRYW